MLRFGKNSISKNPRQPDKTRVLDLELRTLWLVSRPNGVPTTNEELLRSTKNIPGILPATVKDFVDHIDYAVKLIGLDYVGIASDFEGGGGVNGWSDSSETLNVTLELVRRGYSEEQIAKLWGGNLLRVMDEVQRIARGLQSDK